MVQESVQQCRCEGAVIIEDFSPVFERTVRRDDSGASFIARTDNLEEAVSAEFVDRKIAQLINDEYRRLQIFIHFTFDRTGRLCCCHGIDDVDCRGKKHRMALQAGSVRERSGKMAFAQTDRANKNDVALLRWLADFDVFLHLGSVQYF